MLEEILNELQKSWDYTTEEINDIREKMAVFAFHAISDIDVRREVYSSLPVGCIFEDTCLCCHGASCPSCDR
jgi:hypothetical protein